MDSCIGQFLGRFLTDINVSGTFPNIDIPAIETHATQSLAAFEANEPQESQSDILSSGTMCLSSLSSTTVSDFQAEVVEAIVFVTLMVIVTCVVVSILITEAEDEPVVIYVTVLLLALLFGIVLILRNITVPNTGEIDQCLESTREREDIYLFQLGQAVNSAFCAY